MIVWRRVGLSFGLAVVALMLGSARDAGRLASRHAKIAALVVDQAGNPRPGVVVAFNSRNGSIWLADQHQGTLSDGIAWFDSPCGFLDPWPGAASQPSWPKQPPNRFAIALPLAEPVTAAVHQDRLPDKPVRLVLPPIGRVTLRLRTNDGRPFLEPASVKLRTLADHALSDSFSTDLAPITDWEVLCDPPEEEKIVTTRGTASGAVTFAAGTRTRLVARIEPDDRRLRAVDVAFDGPSKEYSKEGDEKTIDVVCGAPATVLTGRFVLPNGKAPYEASVGAVLALQTSGRREAWSRTRAWFHTRENGSFETRFDVDPALAAGARVFFDMTFAYRCGKITGYHPDIVGMAPIVESRLPATAVPGSFDLGAVAITPSAAGNSKTPAPAVTRSDLVTRTVTVKDDRGAPIDLARVSLRCDAAAAPPFGEWTTDIDGRAVCDAPRGPVDVCACARGHRSATVRGATSNEIAIVLERAAPRHVSIRLDPSVALPEPPLHLGATFRKLREEVRPPGGSIREIAEGERLGAPLLPDDASTPFIDRALFGPDRLVDLSVPDPGSYTIEFFVVCRTSAFADEAPVVVGDSSKLCHDLTIGANFETSLSFIKVDPAALAAAVDAAIKARR